MSSNYPPGVGSYVPEIDFDYDEPRPGPHDGNCRICGLYIATCSCNRGVDHPVDQQCYDCFTCGRVAEAPQGLLD